MGQTSATHVLVVARSGSQDPIGANLRRRGYAVRSADGAASAARLLEHDSPDIVVIQEHVLNARELADLSTAAKHRGVPTLVASAAHVCDPRAPEDALIQRMQALLAPSGPGRVDTRDGARLSVGSLVIDLDRHTALLGGRPLLLTPKEFDLLWHLARTPGRVLSRQQLMDLVWGHDYMGPRVVTVHLSNLRRKLAEADAQNPVPPGAPSVVIEAVRDVGYRLVTPAPARGRKPTTEPGPALAPTACDGRPAQMTGPTFQTPFVGRERELEALRASLDTARKGEVQLVAIAAEAGIGKTRLVQELAVHAGQQGVKVYWGRCHDSRDGPPYESWVEVLDRWRQEGLPDDLLGVLEPRRPTHLPLEGQEEYARRELLEKALAAVRWKAAQAPIGIVLEDLHWADPPTLSVLHHVARYARDVPLFLLFTFRPEEGDASRLRAIVADVTRADGGLVLHLPPLRRTEVADLVEGCGAGDLGVGARDQLVTDLCDLTDGNPFYLTQVMRLLLLHPQEQPSRVVNIDLGGEMGVKSVILQRLSRLSPVCRQWLEAAAVFGREFTGMLVSEAVDLLPDQAEAALAEALESRMTLPTEEAPARYRFVHSLVREVLYGDLPPRRRALLHGRAGTILERLHANELDRHAARLAHHYSAAADAGCAAKAVEFCLRAGRLAASQYAWDQACRHWRRALTLLELLPAGAAERSPRHVASVYEDVGDACQLRAETDQAMMAYDSAAACLSSADDPIPLARLKRKQVQLAHLLGQDPRGAELVNQAEALLETHANRDDPAWWHEWLEVKTARAFLHYWANEAEKAHAALETVSPAMETQGTPRQRAAFNLLQVLVEMDSQAFLAGPETVARAEACAACYRELGSPADLQAAEQVLSLAYLHSSEHREKAHRHLLRLLDSAARQHDVVGRIDALHELSCWHRWRGEVEKVRGCASEILSLVEAEDRRSTTHVVANARANLGWVAFRDGHRTEARDLATAALADLEGHSLCEWQARWPLLGLALLAGDWIEVVRQAEAMLDASQMQMPDHLRDLLQRAIAENARGIPPLGDTVAALIAAARSHGYL